MAKKKQNKKKSEQEARKRKAYEYLKEHNEKYDLKSLKKRLKQAGYTKKEISEAEEMLNPGKKQEAEDKQEKEQSSEQIDKQVKKEQEQAIVGNKHIKKPDKGKQLKKYSLEVDGAKVDVEIVRKKLGVSYNLIVPEIGKATKVLLDEMRNELVSMTTVSMKEILDPSAFEEIKKRFMNEAEKLLKRKMPSIKEDTKQFLIGKLMQEMLGLGEIEFLVNDPNLEEIVIVSSKEEIRVYHNDFGWIKTNILINEENEIVNYSKIIARRVGREITVLSPLLDAHLVSGDRVNAILYPISTDGNTITIRKFARDPFTIIDLIQNNTLNIDIAVLLWLAIEYEMNILISGGTASGKTVILNACMSFMPPNHRLISVEDTRELMLPDFLYWTPLVTRTANPEGKGEVSMLDLLVNSLRMRPDRIIMGEIRRKQEATVLFEAMHTGHSVYATLHADTAAETVSRLTNPPLDIPANLLDAVDLNVVMFRDRRRGIRRVFQVAEVEAGEESANANILYRWVPEGDKIIKHGESSRFFEDITRITGLSGKKLEENLQEKKEILEWLMKHKIRDLQSFGKAINIYYGNKEMLLDAIKKDDTGILK
ncbi:MAG: ATPase, T2SS/T4P/T4SS family [Candidatus Nanoarchaeia archaeon]